MDTPQKWPKVKRQRLGLSEDDNMNTTPKNRNSVHDQSMDMDSPVYFPSTQEGSEEYDVGWDWNSPQSHEKKRKTQRRLMPSQSPKPTLRRHLSKNNFEKLEEEWRALKQQLASSYDEHLHVSPQQEDEFKQSQSSLMLDDKDLEFNDSLDEHLLEFTQKFEDKVEAQAQSAETESFNPCDTLEVDALLDKYLGNSQREPEIKSDHVPSKTLKTANAHSMNNNKNFNTDYSRKPLKQSSFQRFNSDGNYDAGWTTGSCATTRKVEFNRTKSFEDTPSTSNDDVSKNMLQEIERKRLEALARLNSKRRQLTQTITSATTTTTHITSFTRTRTPTSTPLTASQCSNADIEKKRKEALARLEKKKMQELIERKRQEALKRRQLSMQKQASQSNPTVVGKM